MEIYFENSWEKYKFLVRSLKISFYLASEPETREIEFIYSVIATIYLVRQSLKDFSQDITSRMLNM